MIAEKFGRCATVLVFFQTVHPEYLITGSWIADSSTVILYANGLQTALCVQINIVFSLSISPLIYLIMNNSYTQSDCASFAG